MEELQLEEQQKTIQQAQDRVPYDPNAADRFPEGYTPFGRGRDNTPVEQVDPVRVGEVEATADISVGELVSNYIASRNEIESPAKFSSVVSNVSKIPLSVLQTSAVYFVDITQRTIQDGNDTLLTPNDSDADPIPEPPVDPPEPPVEPPVDPPEPDGGGNPGNDKDVGNSPWDGETGASDNPGKGNHQDGQDPEPNQPPGDSKNDGPNGNQNPPSENDHGNGGGGGKPESKGNNGWGNRDDDAPGNSLIHNNAENDQTPSGHTSNLIDKFLENYSTDPQEATYDWHQDIDPYLDYPDEMPIEVMDHVDLNYIDDINLDNIGIDSID